MSGNWARMRSSTAAAGDDVPSPYGQKYEILGSLTGPNGKSGWVRTIWIVLTGETAPRLVTIIPAEKQ